jgi:hypothetical protein
MLSPLVTCSWENPFPEYQGVNLIEDRGLSVDSFAHAYVTDPGTTFEYVRVTPLTPAEYGSASGLPAAYHDSIRRLEAVNLFPDGDFEQSTDDTAPAFGWDIDASTAPPKVAPAEFTVQNDEAGVIQGHSVRFSAGGESAAVLDLDSHALDGFIEPAIYFLSLQFRRDSPAMEITFDYGDASTTSYLDNQPWVIGPREAVEPLETLPTPGDELLDKVTVFAASGTGENYFYVGSPAEAAGQAGYLDNIRMGRLDGRPHVSIPISFENANGGLPVIAGTYRVSVYVKSEIDDQITPGADGDNRFRAGQIVIGLNKKWKRFSRGEAGWSPTAWTEVSTTFQLTAEDLAADPPAHLRLTVIDPDYPVIGSVLIAEPRLELESKPPR